MYFVRRKFDLTSLNTAYRLYSYTTKNHYEVLNLRKNCTDKEIREAFIRMSKEYHPDKNKDAAAQAKFVQIVAAYNVLGKPKSRAQYDSIFKNSSPYVYKTHVPYNVRRQQQYNFYDNVSQQQSHKMNNNGIFGVKKLPNYVIILMCCGLAVVGCFVQMFVVRELYVGQRQQAYEKSKRLAEELERVRNAAQGNGNEVQSRLLLEKIVTAANPTVATASLGQALASEKKDAAKDLVSDFGIPDITSDSPSHSKMQPSMDTVDS